MIIAILWLARAEYAGWVVGHSWLDPTKSALALAAELPAPMVPAGMVESCARRATAIFDSAVSRFATYTTLKTLSSYFEWFWIDWIR